MDAVDDADAADTALACPRCKRRRNGVRDSRSVADGTAIRRRRHCAACGHRWTTFEVPAHQYDATAHDMLEAFFSMQEIDRAMVKQLMDRLKATAAPADFVAFEGEH